jgi:hypothetical protein
VPAGNHTDPNPCSFHCLHVYTKFFCLETLMALLWGSCSFFREKYCPFTSGFTKNPEELERLWFNVIMRLHLTSALSKSVSVGGTKGGQCRPSEDPLCLAPLFYLVPAWVSNSSLVCMVHPRTWKILWLDSVFWCSQIPLLCLMTLNKNMITREELSSQASK